MTFVKRTDRNSAARSCKHRSSPICHGPRSLRICLSSTDRTTSYWLITTAISSRSTSSRTPRHRLLSTLYGHTSRVAVFTVSEGSCLDAKLGVWACVKVHWGSDPTTLRSPVRRIGETDDSWGQPASWRPSGQWMT